MFSRPPMLGHERIQVMRKNDQICIEGKWSNIRRLVRDLTSDGWRIVSEPNGEPSGFKFTEVTLERV